jgi:hypothetical protein
MLKRVLELDFTYEENDVEFRRAHLETVGRTLLNPIKCYIVWQLARRMVHRQGAGAEVGVYLGGSLRLIAKAMKICSVFGIDTFAGIPCADSKRDGHKVGDFAADYENVQDYLRDLPNVSLRRGVFHRSMIPDSQEFSFVHLDVDVYESMVSCLEVFKDRMLSGGVILVDDHCQQHRP